MRIKQASVSIVSIPMNYEVQHALASRSTARNVIVTLEDDQGHKGFGESCPREYVSGESVDSVIKALTQHWFSKIEGAEFHSFGELQRWVEEALQQLPRDQHAAFCALELALLDLFARSKQTPVLRLFTDQHFKPQLYSAVIASEKIENVVANAHMVKKFGIKMCKVKLVSDLEHNQKILTAVREVLGTEVSLRGDANAAWADADEAESQLSTLTPFELASIEQPLASEDLPGLTQLTAAKITPVMVDESICSRADAHQLIEQKACDLFNIRISKCGGLTNSIALTKLAAEHGIGCQLGAQVGETSLLSSAGLTLANLTPALKWREGCFGTLLLEGDPFSPVVQLGPGGIANLSENPGFGISPDTSNWQKYAE
ncbi:mandelate racemase/muconate lactonizing enzyme family protein [Corallincola platygyrae]|uniref:Mandelate racemase/muconate lactonizing enzyme family protein n=1 Tax=Corallincola platygyrae TaxID=1193278 RepID=A0ABW4XJZ6_9GAMM